MDATQAPNVETTGQFVCAVPDDLHQVLLIEIARGLGLRPFVRPRAKRRVWVCGSKTEADALSAVARRLVPQFQVQQLKALVEVLEKNGLRPSPNLSRLVTMSESRLPAAQAHPPLSRGEPAPMSEGGTDEPDHH